MVNLYKPEVIEVQEGVYRLGTMMVGFYLLEEGGKFTLIDSGLPGYWDQLIRFLDSRNYSLDNIEAQVLTHHHSDHRGNTERIREETGNDVHIHEDDVPFLENPPPPPRAPMKPAAFRYLAHLIKNKGLKAPEVAQIKTYEDGEVLDVPGRPKVIHTPGHTPGHSCLLLEERRALLTGDAMGSTNMFNGETGSPTLSPSFVNDDDDMARASLDRLQGLDVDTLLVVHGPVWHGPIDDGLELARKAPIA